MLELNGCMICQKCIIGRKTLPALPCSMNACPWHVHGEDYANCFWVIAEIMGILEGGNFSDAEIAAFEGITVDEVETTFFSAVKKIRNKHGFSLMEM